ncbi:27850_t:CDS:1, partial [Racocetra persica]
VYNGKLAKLKGIEAVENSVDKNRPFGGMFSLSWILKKKSKS